MSVCSTEMEILREKVDSLKAELRRTRCEIRLAEVEIENKEKVLRIEIENKDEYIAELEAELEKLRIRPIPQRALPSDVLRRSDGLCFKGVVKGFNGIVGKEVMSVKSNIKGIICRFARDSIAKGGYLLLLDLHGKDVRELYLYYIAGEKFLQLGRVEITQLDAWLDISATHFGCVNYIRNQRFVKHNIIVNSVTEEIQGMTVLSFWSVRSKEPWTLVTTQEGNEYKWWKWTGEKPLQKLGTVSQKDILRMDENGVFGISSSDDRCNWSLYKIEEVRVVQKATWTAHNAIFTIILQSDEMCDALHFIQRERSGLVVAYKYFQEKLMNRYVTEKSSGYYTRPFGTSLWHIGFNGSKLTLSEVSTSRGGTMSPMATMDHDFKEFSLDWYHRVMVTRDSRDVVTLWRQE